MKRILMLAIAALVIGTGLSIANAQAIDCEETISELEEQVNNIAHEANILYCQLGCYERYDRDDHIAICAWACGSQKSWLDVDIERRGLTSFE